MGQQIIPDSYYADLEGADIRQLENCPFCTCDSESGQFDITIWERNVTLQPADKRVDDPTQPPLHEFFHLFIVYMVLHPELPVPVGEWVSEKDFPGGPTFFRGPHLLPTHLISDRFGDDLEDFSNHCKKLGGSQLELADASYRFSILPDIDVAVLYWQGDEDFPAEAKILYDRSLAKTMPLDMIFALAWGICDRLGAD